MEKHVQQTIADLEAKIQKLMEAVNAICHAHGEPERYQVAAASTQITKGQFYGRALATVVTEYLKMRDAARQGTATVAEIFNALTDGGYDFSDSKNDDYAKRGLRQSLTKNPKFHKLPDGSYGLKAWYPTAKDPKGSVSDSAPDNTEDSADDGEEGEE